MAGTNSTAVRLDQPRYRGEIFSNATVIIPAGMRHKVSLAEMDLDDCGIEIECGSGGVIFTSSSFTACNINLRLPFKNFSWQSCLIEQCSFEGRLIGNEFGMKPRSKEAYVHALNRFGDTGNRFSADFSKARLHYCAFYSVNLDLVRFPRWPSFTLLIDRRHEHLEELGSLSWPPHMGLAFKRWKTDLEADGLTALSLDAERCAEEWRMPMTAIEQLRTGSSLIV